MRSGFSSTEADPSRREERVLASRNPRSSPEVSQAADSGRQFAHPGPLFSDPDPVRTERSQRRRWSFTPVPDSPPAGRAK